MYPWGHPPAESIPAYAVGEPIYSGNHRGTVVSVDAGAATMGIIWCDGDSAINYPIDASYLRKALPWEL